MRLYTSVFFLIRCCTRFFLPALRTTYYENLFFFFLLSLGLQYETMYQTNVIYKIPIIVKTLVIILIL